MTITGEEEDRPPAITEPPQDEPFADDLGVGRSGLEALVRTLAGRAFAERASELADRAKAAEERSRRLAERVALLERKDDRGPLLRETTNSNLVAATGESPCALVMVGCREGESYDDGDILLPDAMARSDADGDPARGRRDVEDAERKDTPLGQEYALPESTFSLLVTEPLRSVPFAYAAFSVMLSIACLCLTLASSVLKGTRHNRLGVPGGVTGLVRAAQFLGALVGVLMEDEIPQGLQSIANGVGNKLLLNGRRQVQRELILSSVLRLVVGYLFLSSLFINIAQNSDVIEIFYDVLALEFVENIDTTAFALAKRGFFGQTMLTATISKNTLELPERRPSMLMKNGPPGNVPKSSYAGSLVSNNRTNCLVRLVFFLNAAIVLAGMGYITVSQKNGMYRCTAITVLFEEQIWERAHVLLPEGDIEDRLLVYSNFNGIYREDGSYGGRPRYVEQNKSDGTPFRATVPAEIRYCGEINSWVFVHPRVSTSPAGDEENECSWLWKSSPTDEFDLVSTTNGAWEVWVGEVSPLAQVSMICNECTERSDCNYHGVCNEEKTCVCDDLHFGDSCEFERPCPSLASEKAQQTDPENGILKWEQENPIRQIEGHTVYNRPVYIQKGLSGEPYDMRLYKILKPDPTPPPSTQPSDFPSVSKVPTSIPSELPSDVPSSVPTSSPSSSPSKTSLPTSTTHPTVISFDTGRTYSTYYSGKSGKSGKSADSAHGHDGLYSSKASKQYTPNEYETASDFADWDDFFESKPLHDLEDILDDYSVVLSYSGSRFYGTIIEPEATFDELFPPDYHAFWSTSFNINRTFIISDTTTVSTPVGLDFFEMRRRINTLRNSNVQFSYSPFGVLIPLLSYDGAGFFHCFDETPQPSISPSSSWQPTSRPSECFPIFVNVFADNFPEELSWTIVRVVNANTAEEEKRIIESSEGYRLKQSLSSHSVCLPEGRYYEFTIEDSFGDGIFPPGHYNVTTSLGELIGRGGGFKRSETMRFSIPWNPVPFPSTSPTEECWDTSVNLQFDRWPKDISWTIYKVVEIRGEKLFVKKSEEYEEYHALSKQSTNLCLQEGTYKFTIFDSHGDGIRPPGYYNLVSMSNGEMIFQGEWFRKSKTYSFTIPVLSKPSSIPSTPPSRTPSSSLSPSTAPSFTAPPSFTTPPSWRMELVSFCFNTPGYVDVNSDGCDFYEAFVPNCFIFGNIGEVGMTPNENCCVCMGESWAVKTRTPLSVSIPKIPPTPNAPLPPKNPDTALPPF